MAAYEMHSLFELRRLLDRWGADIGRKSGPHCTI